MKDQDRAPTPREFAGGVAVLVADLLLLTVMVWAPKNVWLRGRLCDGASVWCDGGDPTPAEWAAEMQFRSFVAYGSAAVAAAVVLLIAVAARRWRRGGVVVLQGGVLILIAFKAIVWTPYTPV
jgi:hypothetical protein